MAGSYTVHKWEKVQTAKMSTAGDIFKVPLAPERMTEQVKSSCLKVKKHVKTQCTCPSSQLIHRYSNALQTSSREQINPRGEILWDSVAPGRGQGIFCSWCWILLHSAGFKLVVLSDVDAASRVSLQFIAISGDSSPPPTLSSKMGWKKK